MLCKGKVLYEVEELPEEKQPVINEGEDKSNIDTPDRQGGVEAALEPPNPLTGMGTSLRQGTDNTDVDEIEDETDSLSQFRDKDSD